MVELNVAGGQADEDLLALFGRNDELSPRTTQLLAEMIGSKEAGMDVQQMEGYDELVGKLLSTLPAERVLGAYAPEERVAGLAPEQVLGVYTPEQRVAGLAPEQVYAPEQLVLALPDELLRTLPEEFFAKLSDATRATIRKRIDH